MFASPRVLRQLKGRQRTVITEFIESALVCAFRRQPGEDEVMWGRGASALRMAALGKADRPWDKHCQAALPVKT